MSNQLSAQLPILHPSTILVAGPTGSGKTEFLVKLLTQKAIFPYPQRIIWVYSEWQNAYERIRREVAKGRSVEFIKEFSEELYESLDRKVRNLVVLDDQMENRDMHRNGGTGLSKYFTQGSHHRNLTVIYIVQNLFHKTDAMRTISINSNYLILFKNPRDTLQIQTLATQMYGSNSHFLVKAFTNATKNVPYSHVLIDLRPETPDELRVRSNVFDIEKQCIYVPRDTKPELVFKVHR